jgi:hypothetical protein
MSSCTRNGKAELAKPEPGLRAALGPPSESLEPQVACRRLRSASRFRGIAVIIVFLVRSLAGSRPAANDRPMETLRQLLASGEITSEEFE